jgi:tetratricopeptide (TPR) repeat protein
MLTDLRDRLRGVGRLDVMQAVNQRALGYYGERQDLNGLSPASLTRRARILYAIAEDKLAAGNLDGALRAYEEAGQVTSEQVAREPDDPQLLFEQAKSYYGIGRVHELREDWPVAAAYYARFASAAERMIRLEPSNPDYMVKVGAASIDLGNIHLNGFKDGARAQLHYAKGVRWLRMAAQARPDDRDVRLKLANAYGWLADSHFIREQWTQSLAARQEQLAIATKLAEAAPRNLENQFRLAVAKRAIAHSQRRVGALELAKANLTAARAVSLRLVGHDLSNAEWLLLRGMTACDLLFLDLGLPGGVDRQGLEAEAVESAAQLHAQHDPRAGNLQRCVNATGKAAHRSANGSMTG